MKHKTTRKNPQRKPAAKAVKSRTRVNPPRDVKLTRSHLSPDVEDYEAITDPKKAHRPVMESVHSSLTGGYRVNKKLPMCFIFDHISPARLFKRNTVYNRNRSFVQWTREELAEATKTDEVDKAGGNAKLMPFDPKPYS
jgi:hypothetical protein